MQTGNPEKLAVASLDEFPLIIAATPASKQERRIALAIILILAFVFIVIARFKVFNCLGLTRLFQHYKRFCALPT